MAKYYKTHYGYRSYNTDGAGTAIAFVILFAIVVWFLAKLFIPLCIVLVIYLVYYFKNQIYRQSSLVLIILSVATIISGFCFFGTLNNTTPETAVAAPIIKLQIKHYGFLEDSEYVQEYSGSSDEPIIIKMSDNIYYAVSSNEKGNKDRFEIRAQENSDNPSKEDVKITLSGGKQLENTSGYISLSNQDFPLGETKFTITASNSAGEVSQVVIVRKISVSDKCTSYNNDFAKLADSLNTYCKAWKSYIDKNNTPASSTNQSSPSSSTGTTCRHYESGRCWDDLEDEAYSQGQYDKHYGRYGTSHYEPDDCDSLCQDILEDAYNEGYNDY